MNPTSEHETSAEAPPILGSWRRVYLLVLTNLGVLIGLFYAATVAYR